MPKEWAYAAPTLVNVFMASSPTGTCAAPASSIEHMASEPAAANTAADFSRMNEEQLNAAAAEPLQRWPAVEAAQLKADTAKADLAAAGLLLEEEQEAQQAAKKRAKRRKRRAEPGVTGVRTRGMRECRGQPVWGELDGKPLAPTQ